MTEYAAPCRQALVRDRGRRGRSGAARLPARSQRGHQTVGRLRQRLSGPAVRPGRIVGAGRHTPVQPHHLDHLRHGAPQIDAAAKAAGIDHRNLRSHVSVLASGGGRRTGAKAVAGGGPPTITITVEGPWTKQKVQIASQLARPAADRLREPLHHAEGGADQAPDRDRAGTDQDVHRGRAAGAEEHQGHRRLLGPSPRQGGGRVAVRERPRNRGLADRIADREPDQRPGVARGGSRHRVGVVHLPRQPGTRSAPPPAATR